MTLAKAILLAVALQGGAPPLAAQRGDVTSLFPPRPAGYVTDVTGTLDPAVVTRLDALAERLKNATGAEIAVAVLPTIGDRAAVDVAVAIGRAWGVGAKAEIGDARRNAGLVILLVPRKEDDPNSGQIFLATGQGLEGIVTDLMAGRVRDLMRPYFSRGDYGAGLEAGIGALAALIAKGMGVSDSVLAAGDLLGREAPASSRDNAETIKTVFYVILVILFLLIRFSATGGRRRRRGGWWGGGFGGGGFGGGGFGGFGGFGGGGGGGGGFGGFGGGGGFSGGGAGGRF